MLGWFFPTAITGKSFFQQDKSCWVNHSCRFSVAVWAFSHPFSQSSLSPRDASYKRSPEGFVFLECRFSLGGIWHIIIAKDRLSQFLSNSSGKCTFDLIRLPRDPTGSKPGLTQRKPSYGLALSCHARHYRNIFFLSWTPSGRSWLNFPNLTGSFLPGRFRFSRGRKKHSSPARRN